ncbi:Pex19 protein, partial [Neoconidiobolus thromboides FSU 785]
EEFAKELSKGMEDLLKKANNGEDLDASMENLIKSATSKNSFQSTMDQTMNKLKNSNEQVKSEVKEDNMDSFMEDLMSQVGDMTNSGDFEKTIEGLITQIMNKDLLYEPMKDLVEKYPEWLELNKDKLNKEELDKYQKQYTIVQQVIKEFDLQELDAEGNVKSTPENTKSQVKVMDLMQEMQELGQPPAELLKMVSPGLEVGEDGQPKLPKELEECNIM